MALLIVQYGKNRQAMVVAFNAVGTVSISRTHEVLGSAFNIPMSTGTIKKYGHSLFRILKVGI